MTSTAPIGPSAPLQSTPVPYIDPFLLPRPPHVPFGCTVCGGVENEDQILVCDKNCFRECHIYCLRPPLQHIPEDEWYCEVCDTHGSTKHLSEFLDKVEKGRINLKSPLDYSAYIESNSVPLEQLNEILVSNPYRSEFDVQDEVLLGQKVRVFCDIDGRYHTGRIVGRRKNDAIGQVEHLVLFKSFQDSRNSSLMRWVDLQELNCQVSGEVLWVNRAGAGSGYVYWPGQRYQRSLKSIFHEESMKDTRDTRELFYVFGEEEWVRVRGMRSAVEVADWASRGFTKSTSSKAHLFAYLAAWMELEERHYIHSLYTQLPADVVHTYLFALDGGGMGDGIHVLPPVPNHTDLTLPLLEKIATVYRGYRDQMEGRVINWLKEVGEDPSVFTDLNVVENDEVKVDDGDTAGKKKARKNKTEIMDARSKSSPKESVDMKDEGIGSDSNQHLVLDQVYFRQFHQLPIDKEGVFDGSQIATLIPVDRTTSSGGWSVEKFDFYAHIQAVRQEREQREKDLQLQAERDRIRKRVELSNQTKLANRMRKQQQREERARERTERMRMGEEDGNWAAMGSGDKDKEENGSGEDGGDEREGAGGVGGGEWEMDWDYWLAQEKREYATRRRKRGAEEDPVTADSAATSKASKKLGKSKDIFNSSSRAEMPRQSFRSKSGEVSLTIDSQGDSAPIPSNSLELSQPSPVIPVDSPMENDNLHDNVCDASRGDGHHNKEVDDNFNGAKDIMQVDNGGLADGARDDDEYLNSSPSFADDFSFSDDEFAMPSSSSNAAFPLDDPLEPVYVTHSAPISNNRSRTHSLKPGRTKLIEPPPSAAPPPVAPSKKVYADTMSYVLSKLKQKMGGGDVAGFGIGVIGNSRTVSLEKGRAESALKNEHLVNNGTESSLTADKIGDKERRFVEKDGKPTQSVREEAKFVMREHSGNREQTKESDSRAGTYRVDSREKVAVGRGFGRGWQSQRLVQGGGYPSGTVGSSHQSYSRPTVPDDNKPAKVFHVESKPKIDLHPPALRVPHAPVTYSHSVPTMQVPKKSVGFASNVSSGYVPRFQRGLPNRWDQVPSEEFKGQKREEGLSAGSSIRRDMSRKESDGMQRETTKRGTIQEAITKPAIALSGVQTSRPMLGNLPNSGQAAVFPSRDPRLVARANMHAAFSRSVNAQFSSDSDGEKVSSSKTARPSSAVSYNVPPVTRPALHESMQSEDLAFSERVNESAYSPGNYAVDRKVVTEDGYFERISSYAPAEEFYRGREHSEHLSSRPNVDNNFLPVEANGYRTFSNPPLTESYHSSHDFYGDHRPYDEPQPVPPNQPTVYPNNYNYEEYYPPEYGSSLPYGNHGFSLGGFENNEQEDFYREDYPAFLPHQQYADDGVVVSHGAEYYVNENYTDQSEYIHDGGYLQEVSFLRNSKHHMELNHFGLQAQSSTNPSEEQFRDSAIMLNDSQRHWVQDNHYLSSNAASHAQSYENNFSDGWSAQMQVLEDQQATFGLTPQQLTFSNHNSHPPLPREYEQEFMNVDRLPNTIGTMDGHLHHWQHTVNMDNLPVAQPPPTMQLSNRTRKTQLNAVKQGRETKADREAQSVRFIGKSNSPERIQGEGVASMHDDNDPNVGLATETLEIDMRHWSKNRRRQWRRQQLKLAQQQSIEEIDKEMQLVGATVHSVEEELKRDRDHPPTLSILPAASRQSEKQPVSRVVYSDSAAGQKRAANLRSRRQDIEIRPESSSGYDDDSSIDSVRQPGDDDVTDDMLVETTYGGLGYSEEVIYAMKLARKKAGGTKISRVDRRAESTRQVMVSSFSSLKSSHIAIPSAPKLTLPTPPAHLPDSTLSSAKLLQQQVDERASYSRPLDILRQFARGAGQGVHSAVGTAKKDGVEPLSKPVKIASLQDTQVAEEGEVDDW